MFNIGPMEILLVLAVALVVVGPKRLPELGKTIGKSLREFRRAQDDLRRTIEFDLDDEPAQPSPRSAGPMRRGRRGMEPGEGEASEGEVSSVPEESAADTDPGQPDADTDPDDADDRSASGSAPPLDPG